MNNKDKISWKRILIFFIIATTMSNLFRLDIFEINSELKQLPTWLFIFTTILLEGSGVIIGALIAIYLLKKRRKMDITLFGTSKSKSLIMVIIPVIILSIIGVNNEYGLNPHFYGLLAIIGTFIYCVMEEYGWRGYLQEELKYIKPWKRYLAIGILWYLWHLSFLMNLSIVDNIIFFGLLLFGSWGMGQVVLKTKSIIASACFHLTVQILAINSLVKNGINGTEKLIILVVPVVIWILIMRKWKTVNTNTPV